MPRGTTYVDNAQNRRLGRVGAPMGSAPVSRSTSGTGGSSYSSSSHSTYVDNSYNRSVARVGAPLGSMPMSRSSGASSGSSLSTYVDNSYNQIDGRVGAPMGSMPMSRYSGASSGLSLSTYVDNSCNRSVGRVDAPMEWDSNPQPYSFYSRCLTTMSRCSGASSGSSQSTYVDNSFNRSVGQVDAPLGSMRMSQSSGASSGSSLSTYIDNSYNRSVGQVDAPMRMSRCSGASSGSRLSTYVDNSFNRSVGQVDAPLGSMRMSRCSGASSGSSLSTYVDNSFNRSVGQVDAPLGSMPMSQSSGASSGSSHVGRVGAALGSMSISKKSQGSTATSFSSDEIKCYEDNTLNRRLGRVEEPLGTAPDHSSKPTGKRYYVDNAINRELGRVGKEIDRKARSHKNEKKTDQPTHFMNLLLFQLGCDDEPGDYILGPQVADQDKENMVETVFNIVRRQQEEEQWQKTNQGKHAKTDVKLFKYDGPIIPFKEIDVGKKIGQGGFGDVYFAKWAGSVVGFGNVCFDISAGSVVGFGDVYFDKWAGSVVAVKKLRVQHVSQRRLRQFQDEVKVLFHLDHPHIVKFLGACIVTPNLAIVMEYMQRSLYEALHVEEIDYSDAEQYQIMTGMANGLDYLHQKLVAHCDIKSTNILLDIPQDGVVAKISDFGLSMMKNETETSQSVAKVVQGVGTPKYSAPEVLAGSELDQVAMCKADIYSMSLVAWEVICQEEPFFGLNIHQLQRFVMGGGGEVELTIPNDINISGDLQSLLKECWSRNANKRPSAGDFKERAAMCGGIK